MVWRMLVAVLIAVTLAPTTAKPFGSLTVPDMLPPNPAHSGGRDTTSNARAAIQPFPTDLPAAVHAMLFILRERVKYLNLSEKSFQRQHRCLLFGTDRTVRLAGILETQIAGLL